MDISVVVSFNRSQCLSQILSHFHCIKIVLAKINIVMMRPVN